MHLYIFCRANDSYVSVAKKQEGTKTHFSNADAEMQFLRHEAEIAPDFLRLPFSYMQLRRKHTECEIGWKLSTSTTDSPK